MEKIDERRVSVRMPFVSKGVCVVSKSGEDYSGTLRDISITGMFMEMQGGPADGQKCAIDIIFEGEHSRLKIEHVAGHIIRSEEEGIAVRFDNRLEWFILIPLYYRKMRDQAAPDEKAERFDTQ